MKLIDKTYRYKELLMSYDRSTSEFLTFVWISNKPLYRLYIGSRSLIKIINSKKQQEASKEERIEVQTWKKRKFNNEEPKVTSKDKKRFSK